MVVRNVPFGIGAVLMMIAINGLAVILPVIAVHIKRKLWATACRILVIGWLIYAAIGAFASTSEDAVMLAGYICRCRYAGYHIRHSLP